jgi:hypothetical protein
LVFEEIRSSQKNHNPKGTFGFKSPMQPLEPLRSVTQVNQPKDEHMEQFYSQKPKFVF